MLKIREGNILYPILSREADLDPCPYAGSRIRKISCFQRSGQQSICLLPLSRPVFPVLYIRKKLDQRISKSLSLPLPAFLPVKHI